MPQELAGAAALLRLLGLTVSLGAFFWFLLSGRVSLRRKRD